MLRGATFGLRWGDIRSWAAGLAGVCTACSGFAGADDRAPEEEQRELGAAGSNNMTASAATSGADWSCLGDPPAAAPAAVATGTVTYTVPVRSLFGAPITNLSVRVCLPADPLCATPVAEAQGLNPDGLLVLELPAGFNGFLEVLADGHVPTVFYMRKPVLRDTNDPLPVLPIPAAGVTQLAALINSQVVPELAIIASAVVDCQGGRAPGVAFANNLGGLLFFFIDGLPNVSASATDVQGLGGFVNVPTRLVEVTATLEADGRLIGTKTVVPRAGWITAIQVRPAALPLD